MSINISLRGYVGLSLIIEYPSGIMYETQTSGNLCRQSELEGVFVSIGNDIDEQGRLISPANDLYDYFSGPPYYGGGAIGDIEEEDALFIESVLRKYKVPSVISLDRSRLSESDEAWVYVLISGDAAFDVFRGLGPYPRKGVLTWMNSD